MFTLRPMQAQDIPAILAIQEESYSAEVHEDEAVVRSRLVAFPKQAWVADDDDGVCAYLFAYYSQVGQVTPLGGSFAQHTDPDCLYLHDLAVARRAAGKGIGPALVKHKLELAKASKLRYSALVSVQGSERFWSRLGYSSHDQLAAPQAQILADYKIPAVYMTRSL